MFSDSTLLKFGKNIWKLSALYLLLKWVILFYGCSLLKVFPDISDWNITSVIYMSFLFAGCSLLGLFPEI